ncbi:allantoinase AllB [Actinocorallia sp. API 0066]|uniref:allantoinase AllB n=1 Tax=Actinocorallia sp. API 0066 TaxID=2896846 RepID=UPI001E338FBE|nr:allantoinase AllB [Actinocorallia sp. API 0066]MCD0451507.1 allantoinase AllB [Actinocorallia sp. API 0066]
MTSPAEPLRAVRARRVYLPDGERPATVVVSDGRVAAILPYDDAPEGVTDLADDLVLLPGLVDTHVHVNEPGRTQWEGFATATRAAAAGGVTTIVDMPLNSLPPTVDAAALAVKKKAAEGQCHVDVGFWGGAIPGNAGGLPALHAAGVFGFKSFLIDSGVPEFPPLDPAGLEAAMRRVDALFIVHAEDPALVSEAEPEFPGFVASRPPEAEARAVATVIEAARRTGARAHILHLAAADALPLLRQAQAEGIRITAETCPHYLTLRAEDVPALATEYKCCPPIREGAHQDALWEALLTGVITCVVSDHSPCTPDLKEGDFATAWGGIASVQLGLSAIWTEASKRGISLNNLVEWMSRAPADLVGLSAKGRIAVGADADLVAFAPEEEFTVDAGTLFHRNPVTPYHGRTLRGVVHTTWLRGVPTGGAPAGRFLHREESVVH